MTPQRLRDLALELTRLTYRSKPSLVLSMADDVADALAAAAEEIEHLCEQISILRDRERVVELHRETRP